MIKWNETEKSKTKFLSAGRKYGGVGRDKEDLI